MLKFEGSDFKVAFQSILPVLAVAPFILCLPTIEAFPVKSFTAFEMFFSSFFKADKAFSRSLISFRIPASWVLIKLLIEALAIRGFPLKDLYGNSPFQLPPMSLLSPLR